MGIGQKGVGRGTPCMATSDIGTSIGGAKLLEAGDSRLLQVLPQRPGGVELGVGQPACIQNLRHSAVGVPPMPDRDGQSGEDEVAGVARAGAGGAGLVEIAQIHSDTGLDGAGMEKRLGPEALGSEGRAAWRLSAIASRNPVRGETDVHKEWRMTASDREPRTAGRACGLGAAWIDRWAVGERAGGQSSISPQAEPRASEERAVLNRAQEGGVKGSPVVRKVSENARWRHSSFSFLWYELYKILFLLYKWRRGRPPV